MNGIAAALDSENFGESRQSSVESLERWLKNITLFTWSFVLYSVCQSTFQYLFTGKSYLLQTRLLLGFSSQNREYCDMLVWYTSQNREQCLNNFLNYFFKHLKKKTILNNFLNYIFLKQF